MPIQVTNSLTRKKEELVPMVPGRLRLYVCGPTVYGLTHIGNARPVVVFDVIRRYLQRRGFQVEYVSNYTDVDDKIINRGRQDGMPAAEVAEKYIAEFKRDVESLGILPPDHRPRVTESIPEIIRFIEGLVKNGMAYVAADGEVFYSVRKFREYGRLSGKKIDELLVGVRVQPGEHKKDPLDFSLWKPKKAADEPAWDSPWGPGRPGWHIECSAMAMRYFGETFDLHGGGIDLMHPHHENEIAQTEGLTGKPFVKYWLHNNLVTINAEKMSKSVGNIFLTREFVQKYHAETLKFLLLSGHYRSPIDFSERHIRESQSALHRVYAAIKKAQSFVQMTAPPGQTTTEETKVAELGVNFIQRWETAMDDDFNTAMVIGFIFDYVRAMNAYLDRKGFKATSQTGVIAGQFIANLREVSQVLNLFDPQKKTFLEELRQLVLKERGLEPREIEARLQARTEARAKKDFAAADRIRDELMTMGVEIKDSAQGTDWDVTFTESMVSCE